MAIVRGLRCALLRLKASMYHLKNLVYCLVRSIYLEVSALWGSMLLIPPVYQEPEKNPGVQDLKVSGMGCLQN